MMGLVGVIVFIYLFYLCIFEYDMDEGEWRA